MGYTIQITMTPWVFQIALAGNALSWWALCISSMADNDAPFGLRLLFLTGSLTWSSVAWSVL